MRKIMLVAAAIGGLTALGGTAAMASPMHERHDGGRYEESRWYPMMRTGYEWRRGHWNHRYWSHRHRDHRPWEHNHWRHYN